MVETLEEKILEDGQSYQQQERSPPLQVSNTPSFHHQIDDEKEVDDDEEVDDDDDMKINTIPSSSDPSTPQTKEENEEEEAEEEEEESMDTKQSLFSFTLPVPPVSIRKPSGKKMKPYSCKKLSGFEAKLQSLVSNFEPQNFVPPNIGISRYERCLQLLGLWDFANLNFQSALRKNLLAQLIAYYDREKRRSSLNGVRIQVSRADLARAMHIPVKKTPYLELKEEDREVLEDPNMKSGLQTFLLSWVVLVGDIGIIPDDAQSASKMIENGEANKVDWAGLLWKMVEKEITDAPKMGVCLYASHLQHLIMHQKPFMLAEEEVFVPNKEAECTEVTEVAGIVDGLVKEGDSRNAQKIQEEEKKHVDMNFGLGLSGCDENAKEEGRQQNWFLNTQNVDGENLLRPCSSQNMEIDMDANIEQHEEENHVTHTDDFTSRFAESSVDLMQCVDVNNIPFCPSIQQALDPSSTGFVGTSSSIEQPKDMNAHYFLSNSSAFGNLGKRTGSRFDNEEEDDDDNNDSFEHVVRAKRSRSDFDHAPQRSIHSIADDVNHFIEEIKMCSNDKDREIMNCQMHMEYLNQVVQQKSESIEILERNLLEEQQRVEMVENQFLHERMALSHMVVAYQKAIKHTRQKFTEYRRQYPQSVEPLYKDIPGSGGVVLTVREFERQRLEKSESERQLLETKFLEDNRIMNMVLKFSKDWSVKFEDHEARTIKIVKRFKMLDKKFKLAIGNICQNKLSNKILPQCKFSLAIIYFIYLES